MAVNTVRGENKETVGMGGENNVKREEDRSVLIKSSMSTQVTQIKNNNSNKTVCYRIIVNSTIILQKDMYTI